MQPADPRKFTTIAHGGHRHFGPLGSARATALCGLFTLGPGDHVLDIGCGSAHFLLDVLAAHPATGIGVDTNAAFIARAGTAAQERGLADRVTLIARPLTEAVADRGAFSAVICMGSSQAIGSFAQALAWAWEALKPGGTALFADGYWKQPPAQPYLDLLGAAESEMATHAGNAALARDAGFRVLRTMASSEDEWDEYEGLYCSAVERYVDAHPDDPDSAAMAARIRRWHDAYLRWGRATLGFGFYFLLKPSITDRRESEIRSPG
jgi:SAM-dependent methyltransferase